MYRYAVEPQARERGEVRRLERVLEEERTRLVQAREEWDRQRRLLAQKERELEAGLRSVQESLQRQGRGDRVDVAPEVGLLRTLLDALALKLPASQRLEIERRLREEFKFPGTPVQVAIRVKERDKEQ